MTKQNITFETQIRRRSQADDVLPKHLGVSGHSRIIYNPYGPSACVYNFDGVEIYSFDSHHEEEKIFLADIHTEQFHYRNVDFPLFGASCRVALEESFDTETKGNYANWTTELDAKKINHPLATDHKINAKEIIYRTYMYSLNETNNFFRFRKLLKNPTLGEILQSTKTLESLSAGIRFNQEIKEKSYYEKLKSLL